MDREVQSLKFQDSATDRIGKGRRGRLQPSCGGFVRANLPSQGERISGGGTNSPLSDRRVE
jgi:hypothetical protein